MSKLFEHKIHSHWPRNPNDRHAFEQIVAGTNQRLAVAITKATGSMTCAYVFAFIALFGFPALSAWLGSTISLYILWISSEFIQLVMLPILSVGQQVLGRHQELMAEEQFEMTKKVYHDNEELRAHLDAQDKEIIELGVSLGSITQLLQKLLPSAIPQTTVLKLDDAPPHTDSKTPEP